MRHRSWILAATLLVAVAFGVAAYAQQPAPAPATPPPPFATTKVEGTENVYVFRAGGHQSMFVVTSAGVIATDPIGYGRPQMVQTYVDEIKKVTNQPIKWVIYSHHHFDHIAGGKPFKDAGAKFLAHKRAAERLKQINDPHTVLPDETMGDKKTVKLGDTTLELTYLGLNHSDSTIVMRLPKEKVLFAVDFINVGTFPGRGFIDAYPLEWEESLKKVMAMDFDKLIPGHPGQPGGRLGTKDDVQKMLTLLQDASAAVKAEAQAGGCWDRVEKELKLPKYETWPGYEAGLPMVLRRYCGLWGRGT
ncbi:MAG TPA: MBL fold metallo-hydrolase [Methylomirabilota bacterium]|nr:MBL fold metallo-hydrolase [Methylomirabilota bacterium]